MLVNVISESARFPGQGVDTAFKENVRILSGIDAASVVVNSRQPADIVHIHTIGPVGWRGLLFARGKKVVSAHLTPDSFVGSFVGARYWYPLAKLYLRWFYNRADLVLAVSDDVKSQLFKMGVKKHVEIYENYIDVSPYHNSPEIRSDTRKKLNFRDDEFIVICVGQVQPRKGIKTFIEAARKLPDLKFVWVGGIPFKNIAADYGEMKKIMASPPANVLFTDTIPREDSVSYFKAANLFFMPSYQETFGIVVVEAAAAGLPVLVRDLDQYKKSFTGGYITGDERNFTKIISDLKNNPDFYKDGQTKAATIAERYGSHTGLQKLLGYYNLLLK